MLLTATAVWSQPSVVDQDYHLGEGDILQLTVLQQPELDSTLTVRPDGTVAISRVGAVPVAGLTVADAQELIRQRLQLLNPAIENVTLTVNVVNAFRVFVLGAVASPGSYTFTQPPNLWEAVRAAGGPVTGANISLVRLITQKAGRPHTETYDLSPLVTGHGELPAVILESGDTVVIPPGEGATQVPADLGVQVFGSVARPGTVPISEGTRLMTVLMLAGSPLVDSKLKEVWWVHDEGEGLFRSTKVNMKLFLEKGSLAGNPLVYPGDTVRVPQEGQMGWFRRNLSLLLSTGTATAAILIAIDRLSQD